MFEIRSSCEGVNIGFFGTKSNIVVLSDPNTTGNAQKACDQQFKVVEEGVVQKSVQTLLGYLQPH